MTILFLVIFGVLFYQLLLKPVFRLSPSTNHYQGNQKQNLDLMEMWKHLQDYQQKQERGEQPLKKKSPSFQKGFQGGEYIDYEEL